MSGPPCKAALCLTNAASAADELVKQVNDGQYKKEEMEDLIQCADNFIKDVMKIAEG